MGTSLHENFLLGLGEDYDDWEIDLRSSEKTRRSHGWLCCCRLSACDDGTLPFSIERAAQRAASLGLPMLSMGRDETLPAQSPWIFQVGLPNRHQIGALVDGAMRLRGYKSLPFCFPEAGMVGSRLNFLRSRWIVLAQKLCIFSLTKKVSAHLQH